MHLYVCGNVYKSTLLQNIYAYISITLFLVTCFSGQTSLGKIGIINICKRCFHFKIKFQYYAYAQLFESQYDSFWQQSKSLQSKLFPF